MSLPSYPWRRTRHWLPTRPSVPDASAPPAERVPAALTVGWVAVREPERSPPPGGCLVVLGGGEATPAADLGFDRLVRVDDGEHYQHRVDDTVLNCNDERDWERLLTELAPAAPLFVLDLLGLRSDPLTATHPIPAGVGAPVVARALARAAIRLDNPGRVRYAAITRPASEDPAAAAISGFGRALAHETDRLRVLRVEVDAGAPPPLERIVRAALGEETEVALTHGGPSVRRLHPAALPGAPPPPCPPGGAVLISGGAGAIGVIVAEHLVDRCGASVALVGRRPADPSVERLVQELGRRGGRATYLQADVADADAAAAAVASARERFGRLDGVIHAAGTIDDAPLRAKDCAAFEAVLAGKVGGAVALDRATAADELRFFCLMSSFVGTLGNPGQTDYAAANRFLDAFAERRAGWVRAGRRHGRSVSIAWPPWEDGGMRMAPEMVELTAAATGLRPIGRRSALLTLDAALAGDDPFVLVAHGDSTRTQAALDPVATVQPAHPNDDRAPTRDELVAAIVEEAVALAKLDPGQVDPARELGAYGFDSVLLTALANRLNAVLGTALTPVTLFRHPTPTSLAAALHTQGDARITAPVATTPVAPAEPRTVMPARIAVGDRGGRRRARADRRHRRGGPLPWVSGRRRAVGAPTGGRRPCQRRAARPLGLARNRW